MTPNTAWKSDGPGHIVLMDGRTIVAHIARTTRGWEWEIGAVAGVCSTRHSAQKCVNGVLRRVAISAWRCARCDRKEPFVRKLRGVRACCASCEAALRVVGQRWCIDCKRAHDAARFAGPSARCAMHAAKANYARRKADPAQMARRRAYMRRWVATRRAAAPGAHAANQRRLYVAKKLQTLRGAA